MKKQIFTILEKTYMNSQQKTLVTGGNGQLASEIKRLSSLCPEHTFIFADSDTLNICQHEIVQNFILENKITSIINCAAYTAVDKAEQEFKIADEVNHLAVQNLAQIAKEQHIKLIHISTDYVFDGKSHTPYNEHDPTHPESVYGATKLKGESVLQQLNPPDTIIIRTSWLYSSFGKNFVKSMLRIGKEKKELGVVCDQIGTPTYAGDLAETILKILPDLKSNAVEVYHFSNQGVCSWYDFAKAIFEISDMQVQVNAIESFEYPTPATRPFYSVMNKAKIVKHHNLEIPYWRSSLTNCLRAMKISDD